MKQTKDERVEILKKAAEAKKQEAATKALATIEKMLESEIPVNFESVSKASGLSRKYLYQHPTISEKIRVIRAGKINMAADSDFKRRLNQKDRKIRELQDKVLSKNFEIKRLKKQLEAVYGELYKEKI